jgi:MerR family transcriptional regulator, redox-sensitive transcriptional activator SoxR
MSSLHSEDVLSIGEVAERTGVTVSALRFYEAEGLISSTRSTGGQRRFAREVLRRVAFIRVSQQVGLSLDEIAAALGTLPGERTPNVADWARLSRAWRSTLDERIKLLQLVRDELTSCIGCGCLSLHTCRLYNPDDRARVLGQGPRYLLGDTAYDVVPELQTAKPVAKRRNDDGRGRTTSMPNR